MLEKYIAALLVPYLSKYVENIDERQLNIDIWSGKATLNDLVLKQDVLNTILSSDFGAEGVDGTDAGQSSSWASASPHSSSSSGGASVREQLPLRVHRGVCKSVTLDIPISNLRSQPVVVNIGEILITLVAPLAEDSEVAARHESGITSAHDVTVHLNHKALYWDRVAQRKAKELEHFEDERRKQREAAAAAASAASTESGGAPKKSGFFSRLSELVINNVLVRARTVHIRYEDPARRVVVGAVLGGVQLLTIDDETGEAAFVDPARRRRMGKRLELEGLQVYCDDPRHMAVNEVLGRCWVSQIPEWQAWYHAMRKRSRDGSVALSTIFGPVTCSLNARMVFKRFAHQMLDTPYMTVTAQLQHMVAHLTRAQYTTLVKSISRFTNWGEVSEVAALRPRVPVKGHAKVWWRFAMGTVMSVLKEPREARITRRISEICRMDYQVLYRDVVRRTEMSAEKKRNYRFITRFMTVEDMIAGRKYVYAQLANEIQLRRKGMETKRAETLGLATSQQQFLESQQQAPSPLPQKKGWLSWLRGGSGGAISTGEAGRDGNNSSDARALSKEESEEEAFFQNLEKVYGITSDIDQDEGVGSSLLTSSPHLPATYSWLFLSLDVPFMSYQIDMEEGESACLSFYQLYGQLRTLNKAGSCQFHFTAQNLTLSNPATGYEGGDLITNLVEGVAVSKSPSRSSSAPSSSTQARSLQVRSLTDIDNGKAKPDRAPSLREILGIGSAGSTQSGATECSTHSNASSALGEGGGGSSRNPQRGTDKPDDSPGSSTSSYAVPLLSLSGALQPVEQPLADTCLDAALSIKLLPLRVVADPGTIRRIVNFFRVPRGVDLAYFKERARSAVTAVGTVASQELRTAMASAKGLFLRLDASAPIILLPQTLRASRTETTLAVSLGRIRFHTQPLSEKEKQRRLTSATETEDMLYYSNRASFSKFFVELTTLEDALARPGSGMLIIPTLAIAADVMQRIDERNDGRERTILRLKVPRLILALSIHQVYLLTAAIDAWIRNWATGAHSSVIAHALKDLHGGGSDGGGGGGSDNGNRANVDHTDDMDGEDVRGCGRPTSLSESLVMPQRGDYGSSLIHTGTTTGTGGRLSGARSGGGSGGLSGSQIAGRRSRGAAGGGTGGGGGRASSADGGVSAGVSNVTSPTALPLAGRQEDLPVFRLELLVEALGIDVHEDDSTTMQPIFPARYALGFHNAELLLAVRTAQKKILIYLNEPCVSNLHDEDRPILGGSTALRIDVGLIPDVPTSVGVVLEPSVSVRIGTPFIELMETIMDMVNLILSCTDGAKGDSNQGTTELTHLEIDWTRTGGVGSGGGRAHRGETGHRAAVDTDDNVVVLDEPLELNDGNSLDSISGIGVSATGATLLTLEEVAQQTAYLEKHKATLSDLAYQLGLVRLHNATPDTRTGNISIHIDGTTTVELFNRSATDTKDQLFLRASVTDVNLFCKKNRVTMEVTGKVGEVAVELAECHGLLNENSALLYHTLPTPTPTPSQRSHTSGHMSDGQHDGESGSIGGCRKPPAQPPAASTADIATASKTPTLAAADAGGGSAATSPPLPPSPSSPHIAFTFRKSRPVMPLFATLADGKRVMTNATELRYSSTMELEVGGSTVTLDVQTMMLLKLYFTEGFFTRLSRASERPLYNGHTFPPTREGPRLLMSTRVVARDITVALPLDARRATEGFGATVGNLVVQSSLDASEGNSTTSISLRELALWKDTANTTVHSLLPKPTYVELAMRTPIDFESDETPRLDVKSEDFTVDITSADLLDMCQLLRQNLTRAEVPSCASVAVNAAVHVFARPTRGANPVLLTAGNSSSWMADDSGAGSPSRRDDGGPFSDKYSDTTSPTAARGRSDVTVGVRFARAALRFSTVSSDEGRGANTPGAARFELGATGLALALCYPSNAMGIGWRSLELLDTRGGTTAALIRCDEGDANLADSLTTHAIVRGGFGVRPLLPGHLKGGGEEASATTVDEEDANSRVGKPGGGGGAGLESVTGSDATASPVLSRPPPAPQSVITAAETGVGSNGRGARASRLASEAEASAATPDTSLLSMSVLSVAFTLRCFAVSDQWLSIYDYFCNEALVASWSAPLINSPSVPNPPHTTEATAATTGANGANENGSDRNESGGVPVLSSRGFRCVVTTPSVVVPFLTASRETLFEASIHSLLVDTVSFPGANTHVALKVRELEVLDVKSGEYIVTRRRRTASSSAAGGWGGAMADEECYQSFDEEDGFVSPLGEPRGPFLGGGMQGQGVSGGVGNAGAGGNGGYRAGRAGGGRSGGAHATSPSGTNSSNKEPEALSFFFTADPAAHRHRLQLSLGRLDVVYSSPLIFGMMDYVGSPSQPIARLSSLGVMREQRERVARAAQAMVDENVLSVHVLWHQPRIMLAGDGMDLKNHTRRLEARLGAMKAAASFDKASQMLAATVHVRDFSIPALLEKSRLHVAYSSRRGTERVTVTLDRMVSLFFPAEIDHVTHVLFGNLTLPRETYYYGKFDSAEDIARRAMRGEGTAGSTTVGPSDGGSLLSTGMPSLSRGATSELPISTPAPARRSSASPSSSSEAVGRVIPKVKKATPAAATTTMPNLVVAADGQAIADSSDGTPLPPTTFTSLPMPVPAARTISVQINDLVLEVHDFVGINTHTLTLSSLSTVIEPSGDIHIVIPTIRAVEHFTGCAILSSGATDASGAPATTEAGSTCGTAATTMPSATKAAAAGSSSSTAVSPTSPAPSAAPAQAKNEHSEVASPTVTSTTATAAAEVSASSSSAMDPRATTTTPASPASPAPSPPPPRPAIAMCVTRADAVTALAVNDVVFTIVSRGTGVLVNTLLSVQAAQSRVAAAVIAAHHVTQLEDSCNGTDYAKMDKRGRSDRSEVGEDLLAATQSYSTSRKIEAPMPVSRVIDMEPLEDVLEASTAAAATSPPTATTATTAAAAGGGTRAKAGGGTTTAPEKTRSTSDTSTIQPIQSFRATLDGCGVRFMQNETSVAFAKLLHVGVASETYKDGSSLLNATIDDFTMVDLFSVHPVTNSIVARYVDDQDLNATSNATDAAARKLLDFTMWRAPEEDRLSRTMSISRGIRENNLYARRVHCELANLSFVLVPDVAKALSGTVTEVMQHISEVNRGKAYAYVSDTAEAAAQAVASRSTVDLSELAVIIHRPRLFVLHRADSADGFELFPGRLTLRSELALPRNLGTPGTPHTPGGTSMSPMSDLYREVIRVRVERMGVKLLGEDAFKRDCQINVIYQTALPAPPSLDAILADVRAELLREGFTPAAGAGGTDDDNSATDGSRASPTKGEASGALMSAKPRSPASIELRGSTGAFRDETELRVSIPSVAMNLTGDQTRFAMDIVGAFANSEVILRHRASTPPVSGTVSVASGAPVPPPGTGAALGDSVYDLPAPRRRAAAAAGAACTVGGSLLAPGSGSLAGPRLGGWQQQRAPRADSSGDSGNNRNASRSAAASAAAAQSRAPVKNPNAVHRSDVYIGQLEADLAEIFRLRIDDAHALSESSHSKGSTGHVTVKSVLLQHVGAQVEVADASTGERRSTRVDDLVDILTVDKVEVDSRSPSLEYHEESMSISEERSMDIKLGCLRVAISPTILFDTRELLYLPFCAKVLRQPIEPLPILRLEEEKTVLTEDLTLDSMRVLLTGNRKRCCYHLDLNGHTLRLTGSPSGQIVLNEGCELTIMNGTIVIPGMYAIGSYVSFAASTALFTTDTCTVEKVYQNISNIAFAMDASQSDMRAAAAAALAGSGERVPTAGAGAAGGGHSSGASASAASPRTGPGARPNAAEYRIEDTPVIQQRSSRLMGNFTCDRVALQVLSEETVDLSTSICMEMNASFMQDTENDVAVRRNVSVQLFQVRSGDSEQHTLLPTSVSGNFSGVENVSVAVLFGPVQFCARAVLLRSLVEIGKDFGAAFLEETTVKRFKPTVQLETENFAPLITVVSAGECQHCGQHIAYLSENANTAGTLCYKCCTGRDSMPAADFRVEVPLVDAILLAANGDMAHAYIRNVLLSIDTNMDARLTMRGAFHNFSNAAAVWEPFVEVFACGVTGSVNTHAYRVRVDRLDYVLSPLNVRVLMTLMNDYASSTTLQKRMRKKFRRHTQQRAEVGCPSAPMYVDEVQEDEDDRISARIEDVDDELTFGSTLRGGGDNRNVSLVGNMSIFDYFTASRRQSLNHPGTDPFGLTAAANNGKLPEIDAVNDKVYAHVHVENFCNATLLVEKKSVAPRGGILRLKTTRREVLVEREQAYDPADKGYLLSLMSPALYSQAKDLFMETRVELSRDEVRRTLRRVVRIKVLPLHSSKTLLCMENKLTCWLCPGDNLRDLAPGDRYYMRAPTDLTMPFVVRPTQVGNGLSYAAGVTEDGRVLTVQEVLTSLPFTVVCRPMRGTTSGRASAAAAVMSSRNSEEDAATLYAHVVVRQDAIRGGVPTFVVTVEPRFRLCNKLPYTAMVSVSPDPDGQVAKGRAKPTLAQSLSVETMGKAEVMAGSTGLEGIAISVEIHQPSMQASPVRVATGASSMISTLAAARAAAGSGRQPTSSSSSHQQTSASIEVFTSVPVSVKPGVIRLKSSSGRELVVRLLVCGGSILLTTPFILLNHTDYPLMLRECDSKGEVRRVDAERNYSTLAPKMNSAVAAAPLDVTKEVFLVNFYSGNYTAKIIPLHVQQRGLIILEEAVSAEAAAAAAVAMKAKEKARERNKGVTNLGTGVPDHTVIHLAYLSRVDVSGAIQITITPRWVIVNRSPRRPIYVVPTAQAGISAVEAEAAATAHVTAASADGNTAVTTPTTLRREVDAFREALVDLTAETDSRLTDTTYVVAVGPKCAQPLYKTPYCIPELGYHAHVLQSPDAPLFGMPIALETIHNEIIVAYRRRRDGVEDDGEGEVAVRQQTSLMQKQASSPSGGSGGSSPLVRMAEPPKRPALTTERDRFFDISLVALDPYTYMVVEEPATVPFLLLNRTRYSIELRDTAPKSRGRLMARASSGCGTVLVLDPTVSTMVRVVNIHSQSMNESSITFDVGRPMTAAERASPPAGLLYEVSYGELGQTVLEIMEAKPLDKRVLTARACPPSPVNLLLNMAVLTIAVVIPNRDVLFAAIADTRLSWDRAEHNEEVQFSVRNFQIDNQTEIAPRYESCMLALRKSEDSTAISGMYKRTIIATKALIRLNEVRLDISPVALRVSDTLLVTMAHFVRMLQEEDTNSPASLSATTGDNPSGSDMNLLMTISGPRLLQIERQKMCPSSQKLYDQSPRQMDFMATRIILDRFIVNPLLVRLWLTRDNDESDFFRDGLHTKEAALLSMLVASCEDVHISAPGLVAIKRSSRLGVLTQWIIKSYTDGLIAQLEGVLLQYASSLPLIGAPLKLFSGIGSGAVRLYREPVDGLATSPRAFAQGLARGSGGFAAGFAGGGLGAVSNLANAGSRLLSMGSGVSEKERRKQNTLTGFASGFTGIVRRPMEGAAESGASGFARGAAQGFIGIFANPLSGILSDLSRGTGTVAKLVNDTYIPHTHRLRPLRAFHANGGVAPWRSVINVYQYERLNWSTRKWSANALMSSVDGPEWYPCRRDEATYGKDRTPVPEDCWIIDRYNTSFEGWTLSSKYYGYYTGNVSDSVRVRRKRWTALVRPLPYSPMAFHLGICPGMARAPTIGSANNAGCVGVGVSRTSSMDRCCGRDADLTRQTTSVNLDHVRPGELSALTYQEAATRRRSLLHRRGRSKDRTGSSGSGSGGGGGGGNDTAGKHRDDSGSGKHSRSASAFYSDDEFEEKTLTAHQRMRSWTATGRNVGVKGAVLRTNSSDIDNDLPIYGPGSAMGDEVGDMQRPCAPRSGRFRADRDQQRHQQQPGLSGGSSAPDGDLSRGRQSGRKERNASERSGSCEEDNRKRTGSDSGGGGSRGHSAHAYHQRTSSRGVAEDEPLPMPLPVKTAVAAQAASRGAPRLTASEDVAPMVSTTVELVEYEKKTAILGWGKYGLPANCPAWQDVHGRAVEGRSAVVAPEGWRWLDDWHTVGGDGSGWSPVQDVAAKEDLRRRRWRRTMVKKDGAALPPS